MSAGCRSARDGKAACPKVGVPAPVLAGSGPLVWMDCRTDADCAARPDTVCHRAVMGGTCAPRCEEDARCAGVVPGLVCVAGECVPPAP